VTLLFLVLNVFLIIISIQILNKALSVGQLKFQNSYSIKRCSSLIFKFQLLIQLSIHTSLN